MEMREYTLGPLPWSEDLLRKAYFRNFISTRKAIQEHPGFFAHQVLSELKISLEMFSDCVNDLLNSVEQFRSQSCNPEFWRRPAKFLLQQRERAVRKGLFTAAISAMALVDHSRRITECKIHVPGYEEKKNEMFREDEKHNFIQGLRDFVAHRHIVQPNWIIQYSAKGRRTNFILSQEILLSWKKWNKHDRQFIERHPKGIDVEELFLSYRHKVEHFHNWFHEKIEQITYHELSEYRKYDYMLKQFATKSLWNIILNQVVKGRLDPYTYLDRYLTKQELDEVFTLPKRSQKQVDRIIEILDEYGACDDELRESIYSAFGVDHKAEEQV